LAAGGRTSLNELFEMIRSELAPAFPHVEDFKPVYRDFRAGDIRHSQAEVAKARRILGYDPVCSVAEGLREALAWYTNAGKSVED